MDRRAENNRFAIAARARLFATGAEGAASLLALRDELLGLVNDLVEAIEYEQNLNSGPVDETETAAAAERVSQVSAAPNRQPAVTLPPAGEAPAAPAAPAPQPSAAGAPNTRLRVRKVRSGALPPPSQWQSTPIRWQQ